MKYIFILGRNIQLSKQEIFSYLKRKGFELKNHSVSGNSIFLDIAGELNEKSIEELGGTIAIGKVSLEGKIEEQLKSFEIYSGTKNNISYVLWNYASEDTLEDVSRILKEKFKEEKVKASEKIAYGKISLQEGNTARKINSKTVDEKYFVYEDENSNRFFGKIIAECDYREIEKRDMGKPVRRNELAISPRMAKIMINLSEVKKGPLLDAFCGIGTILYESLLQGINVIGVDKEKNAIIGAKKNLAWARFNQKDYKLIENDSRKVRISQAECLVSEPDLGKTWKRVPTDEEIKKQINLFENLIIGSINNLRRNITGKIVFSAPLIQTKDKNKKIGCDAEKILSRTGLKISEGFPIKEYRKGQVVGREIFVLQR